MIDAIEGRAIMTLPLVGYSWSFDSLFTLIPKRYRSYALPQPAETEEPTMAINPRITTHDKPV
jgi:hypothetical protein